MAFETPQFLARGGVPQDHPGLAVGNAELSRSDRFAVRRHGKGLESESGRLLESAQFLARGDIEDAWLIAADDQEFAVRRKRQRRDKVLAAEPAHRLAGGC